MRASADTTKKLAIFASRPGVAGGGVRFPYPRCGKLAANIHATGKDAVLIESLWNGLLANFALVALVVSLWTYGQDWLESWTATARAIAFGLLLGSAAIAMMLLPVPIRPGLFLDLRVTPLVISGFFGGPVAAIVGALLA